MSRHTRPTRVKARRQRQRERAQHQQQRELRRERRARQRRRQARRERLATLGCPDPSRVLAGVYHPERLVVRDPCAKVTGTVATLRSEEDGDVHIGVRLDSQYRPMLRAGNRVQQAAFMLFR